MIMISVAICTYNNASLLTHTLATLEKQRATDAIPWSALVVDNNSSDTTPLVVQQYVQRGLIPGLRYVREQRQGLAYARRCAVKETESDVIAFVDDDCRLAPDWVEQAAKFCEAHPRVGAVGGRVQLLWDVAPDEVALRHADCLAEQDHGEVPCPRDSAHLVGAGLVLRREALLSSGWMDRMILSGRRGQGLTSGDDTEIVLRVRSAGYQIWYNPAMHLEHYIPRKRMSLRYLCQLHRGIGQSIPEIYGLDTNHKPTFIQRLRMLSACLKGTAKLALSIVVRDLVLNRRLPPERTLAFYWFLGRLEGAWHALPGRFEV